MFNQICKIGQREQLKLTDKKISSDSKTASNRKGETFCLHWKHFNVPR